MTARLIFEGLLTELSKVNAPSMLLSDFNYYINKAVSLHINLRYNIYDVNQQTSDDLRVLKATAILSPTKSVESVYSDLKDYGAGDSKLFSGIYEVLLPFDYLHMLNCICIYKVNKRFKCWDEGNNVQFAAKRLTSDSWSSIVNDFYNRPRPERPYYFIHNVNTKNTEPTNPLNWDGSKGTDINPTFKWKINGINTPIELKRDENSNAYKFINVRSTFPKPLNKAISKYLDFLKEKDESGNTVVNEEAYYEFFENVTVNRSTRIVSQKPVDIAYIEHGSKPKLIFYLTHEGLIEQFDKTNITEESFGFPRTIKVNSFDLDLINKPAGSRHSNPSSVRCEIRYGNDNSVFELVKVLVDYIKTPQEIRLTQELVDLVEDTSQIMEFPDYECNEIINELVKLVMEATADPRLQSHMAVTQSIANPVQQQTQPALAK